MICWIPCFGVCGDTVLQKHTMSVPLYPSWTCPHDLNMSFDVLSLKCSTGFQEYFPGKQACNKSFWVKRYVRPFLSLFLRMASLILFHGSEGVRFFCKWTLYKDCCSQVSGETAQCLRVTILFLKKTRVWFIAPMSGNSQLPAIPALGVSDASGHHGYLHSWTHTHTQIYTCAHESHNKINLKIFYSKIFLRTSRKIERIFRGQ